MNKIDTMKNLIIGGGGTIGRKVVSHLDANHEVIISGRKSADIVVDNVNSNSIAAMFEKVGKLDQCARDCLLLGQNFARIRQVSNHNPIPQMYPFP